MRATTIMLVVVLAVAVFSAAVLSGCLNVKAPEGPYVSVKGGPGWSSTEVLTFLKRARDRGEISDAQYQKLRTRLAEEYKATEKTD